MTRGIRSLPTGRTEWVRARTRNVGCLERSRTQQSATNHACRGSCARISSAAWWRSRSNSVNGLDTRTTRAKSYGGDAWPDASLFFRLDRIAAKHAAGADIVDSNGKLGRVENGEGV